MIMVLLMLVVVVLVLGVFDDVGVFVDVGVGVFDDYFGGGVVDDVFKDVDLVVVVVHSPGGQAVPGGE